MCRQGNKGEPRGLTTDEHCVEEQSGGRGGRWSANACDVRRSHAHDRQFLSKFSEKG